MLNRIKRAVVESYIGAIALGYLLAQIIITLVEVFVAPLVGWIAATRFRSDMSVAATDVSLQASYPEIVRFVLSLILWYILLRWLYMTPTRSEASGPAAESQ